MSTRIDAFSFHLSGRRTSLGRRESLFTAGQIVAEFGDGFFRCLSVLVPTFADCPVVDPMSLFGNWRKDTRFDFVENAKNRGSTHVAASPDHDREIHVCAPEDLNTRSQRTLSAAWPRWRSPARKGGGLVGTAIRRHIGTTMHAERAGTRTSDSQSGCGGANDYDSGRAFRDHGSAGTERFTVTSSLVGRDPTW